VRAVPWQRVGDVILVVLVAAMTESLAWGGPGAGDPLTGPKVVAAALPLLLDLPLLWRRTQPLAALLLVMIGVAGHALISGKASEGLHIVIPVAVASYAVARHGLPRRAEAGLAVMLGGYLVYLTQDHNVRYGDVGERWAAAFFAAVFVVAWSVGLFTRTRHLARTELERTRAAEQWAATAVAEERGRVARELHDIVSHNLSVVVLQASGARAQGTGDDATLEKIELSGRKALNEMRNMLGVLRSADDEPLAPLPGVADLPGLVEGMGAAGLHVEVSADECADLSPGLQLTAYRIVQESLTNALKHARATHCDVTLTRTPESLVVQILDDGAPPKGEPGIGHGLIGMRERCVLAGGRLEAGHDGSGFRVRAELPLPR
jgi:signal transduction histidine kinase